MPLLLGVGGCCSDILVMVDEMQGGLELCLLRPRIAGKSE